MEVVVLVKAYPEASNSYGEAVCVAGIAREYMGHPRWVRLYPVQFRELPTFQKFRKWDRIEVEPLSSRDSRPESVHPNQETIRVIGRVPQSEQKMLMHDLEVVTTCDLIANEDGTNRSLGLVRPSRVEPVVITPLEQHTIDSEQRKRDALMGQIDLFSGERPEAAEVVPFEARCRYWCGATDCQSHNPKIISWELGQSWRSWRSRYPDPISRIERKWNEYLQPRRRLHFFVGNMAAHRTSFLNLGTWAPIIDAAR